MIILTSTEKLIEQHQMNLDDSHHMVVLLLLICSLSNQYKMIAEKMLDTFYNNDEEK